MAAFTLALSSVRSETEVPANAIKLWIALGQTNLVIGQSLDVVVRMRNESDQPLPQEYSVRNASICISYENEPPTRYVGGFAGKKSGRRLAPGHTETITSALLYCGYCPVGGGEERAGRYVFNKPGRYRIGACLGDCFPAQVGFCSPVGVVTVSEPVGTDLIVWKKLVNHPLYAEVVEGVVRSAQAKDLKTLEDIARENPTSAYAPSIFLGLGACYQSNGKLVEACSWYERLLDYSDNLLIKQQAQVRYAEALRDMGQLDKSIVLAEEILENDRETPFRDTLARIFHTPA